MKWSDRLGLLLHPTGACFVFFSSRRRHTRLQGDWSSDVCSSDLCPATSTTSSRRPVRSKTCWASRLAPSASPRGGTARARRVRPPARFQIRPDRKSTRLNSSHLVISYAVFCLKKKNNQTHSASFYFLTPHP